VPAEAEVKAVDAVAPLTDTAVLSEGESNYQPLLERSFFLTSCSESEKQANHGWGANEGDAELKDEQAGEAIAKAEQKEGDAGAADAEEAEPEDNSISYAEYLAQQAEKKLQLGAGVPEARKPNEGSKQDKKWANAKPIAKEDEEDFVAGSGGKAKRERERKQKQVLDIDQRFVEAPERTGGRGGFRGGRGGRGDGPSRGGRGEGGFRGGRGGDRGDRGDGARGRGRGGDRPRGAPRGGASINTNDKSAFPSLGS
jgi:plasminogen activator inhibitor 1 RNA-binding protein